MPLCNPHEITAVLFPSVTVFWPPHSLSLQYHPWPSAAGNAKQRVQNGTPLHFYLSPSHTALRHAQGHWRDDRIWFEFFCCFWNAVRNRYAELWLKSPSNKLFVGANLWALQEAILKQADGQIPSVWQLPDTLTWSLLGLYAQLIYGSH